jgi:hypothetical protein
MPVKYAFILLLGVMMGSFNNMLDTWLVYNHATAYFFFFFKKRIMRFVMKENQAASSVGRSIPVISIKVEDDFDCAVRPYVFSCLLKCHSTGLSGV